MGPLPERAAVGHGARGLQRQAATPGTTSATSSRARAPTAGARTAWPASADDKQRLCFALALWNGEDPILKERLFGLTNSEGNHGEDVKEYYFYLDSTPTHSYMKFLYKYPQAAFPYRRSRGREPAPRPPRSRVRAARHRDLRGRSLLRRVRRVRQGVARRRARPDHGSTTAGPSRRRCTCCPRCGSATPGRRLRAPATSRACARSQRPNPRVASPPCIPELGRIVTCFEATCRRCCSPRTRPTPCGCSGSRTPASTSRTRSTST